MATADLSGMLEKESIFVPRIKGNQYRLAPNLCPTFLCGPKQLYSGGHGSHKPCPGSGLDVFHFCCWNCFLSALMVHLSCSAGSIL